MALMMLETGYPSAEDITGLLTWAYSELMIITKLLFRKKLQIYPVIAYLLNLQEVT